MAETLPPRSTETQSLLTLQDYAALFMRYRIWFLIGLILVTGLTFFSVKFVAMKFFRAEASFFIYSQIPPEQMVGVTDAAIFQPRQNESHQISVQTRVAERLLRSNDLMTSAVANLLRMPGNRDVAAALRIQEEDPQRLRLLLLKQLRDLVQVTPIEGTGIMELSVEMPEPQLAADFANTMLALLRHAFTEVTFGYFMKAQELYTADLDRLENQRQKLSEEFREFNARAAFDQSETVAMRRKEYEERLEVLTSQFVQLSQRVQNLNLATSEEALAAAQPIRIINHAEVPLKKSRPQTILTTMISGVLYTFVFLALLMFVGLFRAMRSSGLKI